MKVVDLMIGDWYANSDGDKCRVIKNFGTEVWGVGVDVSDATDNPRPIPATPEIMSLNGLDCGMGHHIDDTFIRVDWNRSLLSGVTVYNIMIIHDESNFIGRAEVNIRFFNVHELQHALRLCGRSDLADNFKVE